jgi:hypothetical protein
VATTRIPRTCVDKRQQTYVQLIHRLKSHSAIPFEGRLLKTGSQIEEADLRPAPDWPEIPVLIEYAGNDRSGRGHNRSNDLHVLWRYDWAGHEWIEIARVTSQGPEWLCHLMPIIRSELNARPPNCVEAAQAATGRVMALMDAELDLLELEGRDRMVSFLYDRFTARMIDRAA